MVTRFTLKCPTTKVLERPLFNICFFISFNKSFIVLQDGQINPSRLSQGMRGTGNKGKMSTKEGPHGATQVGQAPRLDASHLPDKVLGDRVERVLALAAHQRHVQHRLAHRDLQNHVVHLSSVQRNIVHASSMRVATLFIVTGSSRNARRGLVLRSHSLSRDSFFGFAVSRGRSLTGRGAVIRRLELATPRVS